MLSLFFIAEPASLYLVNMHDPNQHFIARERRMLITIAETHSSIWLSIAYTDCSLSPGFQTAAFPSPSWRCQALEPKAFCTQRMCSATALPARALHMYFPISHRTPSYMIGTIKSHQEKPTKRRQKMINFVYRRRLKREFIGITE